MSDLDIQIMGARSQLNNLRHAKGSAGRPGAMFTADEIDVQIEEQKQILRDLLLQTVP